MPTAMIPWIEVCRTMFERLVKVRKAGDSSESASTMPAKPIKIPYFCKPKLIRP